MGRVEAACKLSWSISMLLEGLLGPIGIPLSEVGVPYRCKHKQGQFIFSRMRTRRWSNFERRTDLQPTKDCYAANAGLSIP